MLCSGFDSQILLCLCGNVLLTNYERLQTRNNIIFMLLLSISECHNPSSTGALCVSRDRGPLEFPTSRRCDLCAHQLGRITSPYAPCYSASPVASSSSFVLYTFPGYVRASLSGQFLVVTDCWIGDLALLKIYRFWSNMILCTLLNFSCWFRLPVRCCGRWAIQSQWY